MQLRRPPSLRRGSRRGRHCGALLAQDMLGTTNLAGLPSALFTAGSALAAVTVGRISPARDGRPRPRRRLSHRRHRITRRHRRRSPGQSSPAVPWPVRLRHSQGHQPPGPLRRSRPHRGRAIAAPSPPSWSPPPSAASPDPTSPPGTLAGRLGIPHLAGLFFISGAAYAAGRPRPRPPAAPRPAAPGPNRRPGQGSRRRGRPGPPP